MTRLRLHQETDIIVVNPVITKTQREMPTSMMNCISLINCSDDSNLACFRHEAHSAKFDLAESNSKYIINKYPRIYIFMNSKYTINKYPRIYIIFV